MMVKERVFLNRHYTMGANQDGRIVELDCLRGLAVCMMLASNFFFDLYYFASLVDPESGMLAWFARATAGLFVLVAGVSVTLSSSRHSERFLLKNVLRGAKIFALGMVVTLVTKIAIGQGYVVFGILHLIGVGIVLSYPFLRHKWIALACGLVILSAAFFMGPVRVSYPWLVWLGIQYVGFQSVDYTPLVPWFGIFLLGVFVGKSIYPEGDRNRKKMMNLEDWPIRPLVFCGRHSLIIYFLHQPLFWGVFFLWSD